MHSSAFSAALRRVAVVAIAASLAGCASGGSIPQAPLAPSNVAMPAFGMPDANVPNCKGQKTTKQYAKTAPKLISKKGGSLCLAAFGGWGGSLEYPTGGSTKIVLTSSTTAYDPGIFPPTISGTPIFYIRVSPANSVTFGTKIAAGGGIESSQLKPKKPYTAQLWVGGASLWIGYSACYTVAKKGKYGGSILHVGTRLAGLQLYPSSSNVIVITDGKYSSGQC